MRISRRLLPAVLIALAACGTSTSIFRAPAGLKPGRSIEPFRVPAGPTPDRSIERDGLAYGRLPAAAMDRRAALGLLAGGVEGPDRFLKTLLDAGYAVRSSDIRDFDLHIIEPQAVWLFSEPGFKGSVRQFRTTVDALPEPIAAGSARVGDGVYLELYPEPGRRGTPVTTYLDMESLGTRPARIGSLRVGKTADIARLPIQNTDLQGDPTAPAGIAGYAFKVGLNELHVDIGIDHQDGACNSELPQCAIPKHQGWDKAYPLLIAPNGQNPTVKPWSKRTSMQLMINGTYFYNCAEAGSYEDAICETTTGLVLRDGKAVIPESHTREPFPPDAVAFASDGWVRIYNGATIQAGLPKDLVVALAANILVSSGTYDQYCDRTCHEPSTDQPRTAIGFDGLGPTSNMFIVVIQSGRNSPLKGVTASRLATYMIQSLGVQQAVMLDGGGSSTFYQVDATQPGGYFASTPGDSVTIGSDTYPVYRPVTTIFGIRGRH